MNNLLKRALSGAVFVIVLAEGTLSGGWVFYALWSLVAAGCIWEFWGLVGTFRKKSPQTPIFGLSQTSFRIAGLFYILLPILLLMSMDPVLVLCCLTLVWANDTGAYLVGVTFGKHKMAPAISPKKSWEGFAGGIVAAVGVALLWAWLYWDPQIDPSRAMWGEASALPLGINLLKWAVVGAGVALGAVAGDLVESKFKRELGIKDSGKIIPGHGGLLDRFDALLLGALVLGALTYILNLNV